MKVISLASGSRGNAYLVGVKDDWLLIDDGLAWRTLCARVNSHFPTLNLNLQPQPLTSTSTSTSLLGVLVTHSHTDHTSGLPTLFSKLGCPIYANSATAESIMSQCDIADDAFVCFENGQSFELGTFSVHPFSIPHDTADPVGFLIRADGETYFHGTDIGTPLDSIGFHLAEADIATLESNHDPVMLRTSGRPMPLIQRIAGPRGHLSNDDSSELVRRFASPKLKRLGLAHLSQDCNTPRLAEVSMRETLASLGRSDISLKIYAQDAVVEL